MTSPSPSSWQASLQPGLIRRLTRPLGRSGLVSTQMGQRILDRATRLNQRLPLLDHQMQRWSKVVDLEAPPLPIVYLQPRSEAELNQAALPGVTPTPPESGVAPWPSLGSEPWPALLPATPAAVPSPSPVGLAGDQGLDPRSPAPTPAPDRSYPLSAPAPLGEQPQSLALPAQPSFPGPLGQSPSLTPANPILAGANIPPASPLPPGAPVSAQTSPVDRAGPPWIPTPARETSAAGFPQPARLITASEPPGPGPVPGFEAPVEAAAGNAIAPPALPPLTPSPLPGPGVIQRRLEPSTGADLGALPLLSRLPDGAPGLAPLPLGPANLAQPLPLAQTWPDYPQTAIPGAVPRLAGEPGLPLGLPRFAAGEDPPVPGFEAAAGNAIAPPALPPLILSPLPGPGVIQRRLEPSAGAVPVPIDAVPTALPPIAPSPLEGQGMVGGLETLALPPVPQPAPPLDRPRQLRSEPLGLAPGARPTAKPHPRISPDKPAKISLRKTRWSQTIAVPELRRSSDEPTPGGLGPLPAGVSPLAFLTPAPLPSSPQGGFQSQPPGIADSPVAALFPDVAGQPTTAPPPGVVPTRSPLPNPASPLPASLAVTRLPGAKSSGGIPPVARIIPPAQSSRVQVDIAWSAPSLPTLPLPLLAMVNAAPGQQRPNHPDAPLALPPTVTPTAQALAPPATTRESGSGAISAVPVPWQAQAEPRPAATTNLNMEALLETVERRLIKRLIVESERRGKPKWP